MALAFAGGYALAPVKAGHAVSEEISRDSRQRITCRLPARAYARLELLFGTTRPDGSIVSEAEWLAFLFELERCEAGHALGYRSLAEDRFGDRVAPRLDWWLYREAELIQRLPWRPAVH